MDKGEPQPFIAVCCKRGLQALEVAHPVNLQGHGKFALQSWVYGHYTVWGANGDYTNPLDARLLFLGKCYN